MEPTHFLAASLVALGLAVPTSIALDNHKESLDLRKYKMSSCEDVVTQRCMVDTSTGELVYHE